MSFYDSKINNQNNNNNKLELLNLVPSNQPKLVDDKVIRKIRKKKAQIKKNNYTNKLKNSCMDFIRKNYGILLIMIFFILILCFRYREVKKRRNKQSNIDSE